MSSLFPDSRPSSPAARPGAKSAAPSSWTHAHCDGGSRGNPGPSGFGAVLVDDAGHTIAELSEFLGIRTNNFAEYSGLLACLDYALKNNLPRLKVVSDSELMVKQIQGKYKVNSPDLKPLWQEARNRIAKLEAFEISHALRHKNKEADALANQAMDRGMKRPATDRSDAPVQSLPLRAIPHTAKSAAPPAPYAANRTPVPAKPAPTPASGGAMLRGFTRDGVVHILGGATLPDGVFVKIIRE
jgi:probable phosphoglycerate mutase